MSSATSLAHSRGIDSLSSACAERRVSLAAQAIVSASASTSIFYRECLARLHERDGAVLAAEDFIVALEASRAAPVLDRHVLELVLDALAADPAAVLGCNLSADNLINEATWAGILGPIRERSELAPRLVLEITETQAFYDLSLAGTLIAEARDLGCRVALDDFGAGFASPTLPLVIDFDIVKIDKAFLRDVRPSISGHSSLFHLVQFAACFSPVVVVEGVETVGQSELARAAGATHLQGHLLSMPLPTRPLPEGVA